MRRTIIAYAIAAPLLLTACESEYQRGFRDGYDEGFDEGRDAALKERDDAESHRFGWSPSPQQPQYSERSFSTEVCGGSGVNVSGKHIKPGRTGCVRVFADGTYERY